MKAIINICFLFLLFIFVACSTGKSGALSVEAGSAEAVTAFGKNQAQSKALPKAIIYRTNGDYKNNVPVTLSASRTSLISFPAPSDVSKRSVPVDLGDGWLFDRRGGIGDNTVFLSYTYDQYAALKRTPSTSELMSAIIPGSAVTQYIITPVTFNEAAADPEILKKYIPR